MKPVLSLPVCVCKVCLWTQIQASPFHYRVHTHSASFSLSSLLSEKLVFSGGWMAAPTHGSISFPPLAACDWYAPGSSNISDEKSRPGQKKNGTTGVAAACRLRPLENQYGLFPTRFYCLPPSWWIHYKKYGSLFNGFVSLYCLVLEPISQTLALVGRPGKACLLIIIIIIFFLNFPG